jgi:hypothetical protein
MPAQPPDEWTYLRPEEFADDDAVEQVDDQFTTAAEDAALHVVDVEAPPGGSGALDPGQTTVVDEPAAADASRYFDDEEPDGDQAHRPPGDEAPDEPGVDEILASQHYSFDPDGQ